MSTISNIAKNFSVVREHDLQLTTKLTVAPGLFPKDVQQPSLTREVTSVV